MAPVPSRLALPRALARRLAQAHGEAGRRFVRTFPHRVQEATSRWELVVDAPLPRLSYAWVATVRRADGGQAVLKVAPPTRELACEIAALRAFDGAGAARLLEADAAAGLLLLERLRPGTALAERPDDEEATRAAAAVMQTLWREPPADAALPRVVDLWEGLPRLRRRFGGGTGPFPAPQVEAAERAAETLVAAPAAPRLLHGDLHHGNVLAAERRPWLAIDPKGVIGDAGWEVAAFLRNPIPGLAARGTPLLARPDPARVLARRLDVLAETLGIERERLRRHGVVGALLSAWWTFEDHGRVGHDALRVAALLEEGRTSRAGP